MRPLRIEVNIDELVLHGFSPAERYRIGEALEGELTRLLTEGGLPSGLVKGGQVDRLDCGSFDVKQGSKGESIGLQVAKSVYGGIRSERKNTSKG